MSPFNDGETRVCTFCLSIDGQVLGLELTTASRAAFLVQLTTVIVPVLEAFLRRQKLKPQVGFLQFSLPHCGLCRRNAERKERGCFAVFRHWVECDN